MAGLVPATIFPFELRTLHGDDQWWGLAMVSTRATTFPFGYQQNLILPDTHMLITTASSTLRHHIHLLQQLLTALNQLLSLTHVDCLSVESCRFEHILHTSRDIVTLASNIA